MTRSAACAVSILGTSQFAAGQTYTITDLDTLGGTYSSAKAINAVGQVAGEARTSDGTGYAFIWERGRMTALTPLPWPGETGSVGRGLSDAGKVVGASIRWPNEMPWTAVLWERIDETWQVYQIGHPHQSIAVSVNSAGQVAGRDLFDACPDSRHRAWRWENGSLTYLDGLVESAETEANDINELGEVVGASASASNQCVGFYGTSAVIWNAGGQITDLGTPGGASATGYSINDAGEVAGTGKAESGMDTAFVWLPTPAYGLPAGMNQLGTLGGMHSRALGINNAGQVVGAADMWNEREHAFIWQGCTIMDLNHLLPPDSGWELTVAYDISENGRIVGSGEVGGETHGFLLAVADDDGDVGLDDHADFVSCMSGPGVPFATAGPDTVDVSVGPAGAFTPGDVTIQVGDTVHWFWGGGFHNVESGVGGTHDGNFQSGGPTADSSTTFDATFLADNPVANDVYPYYCRIHVAFGMVGSVTVEPDPCIGFDADADCDIDLDDYAFLQRSFTASH